jgi:hypothetical protein
VEDAMNGSFIHGGINLTTLLAAVTAVIFFLILIIFSFLIYITQKPVPHIVMVVLRGILALMGGGFAGIIGGELALSFKMAEVTGQATVGLAVAVLLYIVNPPGKIQQQIGPDENGSAAPPLVPPQPPPPERRNRPANTREIGP